MPQRNVVEIPGYDQPIEFPDSMSDLEVNAAASRLYNEKNAPAPAKFPLGGPLRLPLQPQVPSLGDELSRFPSEAWQGAKQFGSEFLGLTPQPQQTFRGEPVDVMPTQSGAMLMSGAPSAINATKPAAASLASRLYESALKPAPRANSLEDVERMVQAGLRERIPVSSAGAKKLGSLEESLRTQVGNEIASNPTATINKFKVASRLNDAADKFSMQVNPEQDLQTLAESGNEFLRSQPNEIPGALAQGLKTGTYAQVKPKSFGELRSAAIESQKHLARGLKEELENIYPNIGPINERLGDVLELGPELRAGVNRIQNRNLLGFATPMVGAGAEMMTGSPAAAAGAGLINELLNSPSLKSRLAIGLSRFAQLP